MSLFLFVKIIIICKITDLYEGKEESKMKKNKMIYKIDNYKISGKVLH